MNLIAQTRFDHDVNLFEQQDCYEVVYGFQKTRWPDLKSAYKEFLECSEHAMRCAGHLDDEE